MRRIMVHCLSNPFHEKVDQHPQSIDPIRSDPIHALSESVEMQTLSAMGLHVMA
jgi:hypothetical protein